MQMSLDPEVGADVVSKVRSLVVAVVAVGSCAVVTSAAVAVPTSKQFGSAVSSVAPTAVRAPGVWLKLSRSGIDRTAEPGLVRTHDGSLLVAWTQPNPTKDFSVDIARLSHTGAVVATNTAINRWASLDAQPRLLSVPGANPDYVLVFNGTQDGNSANPYSVHSIYAAESAGGGQWALASGSASSHTAFNVPLAATLYSGGVFSGSGLNSALWFSAGFNSNSPSSVADTEIDTQAGSGAEGLALTTGADGSVVGAWYQRFGSQQGFYAQQLEPTLSPLTKAPGSGNPTWGDNEPLQQVAMVSRADGQYLAYCQPTKTVACARIVLWKFGSSKVLVVPGSTTGHAAQVALSLAPGGRLAVSWYDSGRNAIEVSRTNLSATRFGVLRTIAAPPATLEFHTLFIDANSTRIDVVANSRQSTKGAPTNFFHTQVLPGLMASANKSAVKRSAKSTIIIHVSDAGDPVAGASVTFLGKHGVTNATGNVTFVVGGSAKAGAAVATVNKTDYFGAAVHIKVS